MLIDKTESVLLVIDVQDKLLPGVHEHETLVENCRWLMDAAELMGVPVMASEQYPQGVGPTVPVLRERMKEDAVIAKTWFSCADSEACMTQLNKLDCPQVVICGMEAHVCVLQTAMKLQQQGKQVYVVTDAISARQPHDTEAAIQRMQAAGVTMVTREMVGFEWVRRSDAPEFREFSKRFLQ